jgi:hypothetical protein
MQIACTIIIIIQLYLIALELSELNKKFKKKL